MIDSAADFARVRTSANPDDQRRATHDEASEATWCQVIDDHPELRAWVAHNKTVPLAILAILAILAVDPDARVRWAVAQKRKLDDHHFALLARDPDPTVRHRVACNARCPDPVLAQLVHDPEPFVRDDARSRHERKT